MWPHLSSPIQHSVLRLSFKTPNFHLPGWAGDRQGMGRGWGWARVLSSLCSRPQRAKSPLFPRGRLQRQQHPLTTATHSRPGLHEGLLRVQGKQRDVPAATQVELILVQATDSWMDGQTQARTSRSNALRKKKGRPLGSCDKTPRSRGTDNSNSFPHSSGGSGPRSGSAWPGSGEDTAMGCRRPPSCSAHRPFLGARRQGEHRSLASLISRYKGTNPITRDPPL